MRLSLGIVGAFGVLWLDAAACRPKDTCAETATACGGDPVGRWTQTDLCQDPALQDSIGSKQTYRNQPMVPGGQSPPELTSTDWCSSLEYFGPSGIRFFGLPRDTPTVQGAFLSYAAGSADTAGSDGGAGSDGSAGNGGSSGDHTQGLYSTLLTSSDTTSISYSASCLQRFGYSPGSCVEFGLAFAAYGYSLGGVKKTSCKDSGDGGCVCSYLIESDQAGGNLAGIWKADGHVITHYAENMVLPTQVDYCVQGNTMTLWGHDRTNILDFNGLRTLVLRKVVCGDGIADRGEECDPDPPDPTKCSPTCQRIITPP